MTATRLASTSALAALVLAVVWFFWPASLGGGATYVSTHGTSMEPAFRTGDLAVLRAADAYSVGDVVAYRSATLQTVVMHRIVAGDAGGFVTRGDNNDWLDDDRPTEGEILGRLFLRVPRGGVALDGLRSPGVLAAMAVAASAALGVVHRWPDRRRPVRSSRRSARSSSRRPARAAPAGFSVPVRAHARQVTLAAAGVALVAGAACVVLAGMPATRTESGTVAVTQEGRFDYSGTAVPGTTYPTGAVSTGDTVWTRLVDGLTVSFTNTVSGPDLADVRGTLRLDVSVTASDGWSAVVASSAEVPVHDRTTTASVAVDTDAAGRLLSSHYTEIGSSGGQATLTVTPVARTAGTVRGQAFTAGSPAPMTFTLDATSLRPGGPDTDLAPSSQTPVPVEEVVPNTVPVLTRAAPIGLARGVAAGTFALAVVVLAIGAWIGRSSRRGTADEFLVRHADRIVPVTGFPAGTSVIDVSDASSLHRVAERFDTVVLHQAAADHDVFVVRDVDATYRLVLPVDPQRRRGRPPVPAPAPAGVPEPVVAPVGASPPPAVPRAAPAHRTAPLPAVPAAPQPRPPAESSGLWGRVA